MQKNIVESSPPEERDHGAQSGMEATDDDRYVLPVIRGMLPKKQDSDDMRQGIGQYDNIRKNLNEEQHTLGHKRLNFSRYALINGSVKHSSGSISEVKVGIDDQGRSASQSIRHE